MKSLYSAFIAMFFAFTPAIADDGIDAVTQVIEANQNSVDYTKISKELEVIENSIRSGEVSQDAMKDYIKSLSTLDGQIQDAKKQSDSELSFVQKRIEALGEEPQNDEKEPELIAGKRREFNSEANSLKAKIAEFDIVLAKVDELENLILNTRNKELIDNLLDKQPPLIYPSNFLNSTMKFAEFCFDIIKSPIDWYNNLNYTEKSEVKKNIIPFFLTFLLSLWVGIILRGFIKRKLGYRVEIENPSYSTKIFAAVFVAVAYGMIPAMIIGAFIVWLKNTSIVNVGFFGFALTTFLYYMLLFFVLKALARVTFTPYNEKWRLININTEKAKKVNSAFYFSIFLLLLIGYLQQVSREANYPAELIYYIRTLSSAIKAFCIILITKRMLLDEKENKEETEENSEDYELDAIEEEEGGQMSLSLKVTLLISTFALVIFFTSLIGYPNLSSFVLNRFIFSALLIGGLLMVRKALREIFFRFMLLKFWSKTLKFGRKQVTKIDFWFMMILDPAIVLFAIFMLLNMWGVSTDILMQSLKKLFFGFSIGGVNISLFSILLGIFVFFLSLAIVRLSRTRLFANVLSKMDIEDSTKHSLASGFGFFGFIASALLAILVMGGSLTNLALIAGALSLGIGLGLQNIVNNFVSGIILLFERPIRIGDWVIIDGQEGIVQQINIRATEIETFTKASVIIPNASILSTNLINMTHSDKMGRVDVKVGVGYGSDLEEVRHILLEIADNNKKLLKKPYAPYVVFQDFGDSYLSFELRGFISDINNRLMIASELRFEIYKRFSDAGIDIPVPQMVIHNRVKPTPVKG